MILLERVEYRTENRFSRNLKVRCITRFFEDLVIL